MDQNQNSDQNFKSLEIEDKINILFINSSVICKKMMRYLIEPRNQIFAKGYKFLSFAENMGKNVNKSIKKLKR